MLIAHLELFAKLRNPRAVYREPELTIAYHDLLRHRNAAVQKLALDCVMQYRSPSLTSYREQLYGLVDDKSFRAQLIKFNLEEGATVQAEHRAELVPVLMSILYSKMQARGSARRASVLRFLAVCREDELLTFLRLAFRFYLAEASSPLDMVRAVRLQVDLARTVPPRRLTSAVSLATTMLAQLGRGDSGMAGCVTLLLRVLLVVAAR